MTHRWIPAFLALTLWTSAASAGTTVKDLERCLGGLKYDLKVQDQTARLVLRPQRHALSQARLLKVAAKDVAGMFLVANHTRVMTFQLALSQGGMHLATATVARVDWPAAFGLQQLCDIPLSPMLVGRSLRGQPQDSDRVALSATLALGRECSDPGCTNYPLVRAIRVVTATRDRLAPKHRVRTGLQCGTIAIRRVIERQQMTGKALERIRLTQWIDTMTRKIETRLRTKFSMATFKLLYAAQLHTDIGPLSSKWSQSLMDSKRYNEAADLLVFAIDRTDFHVHKLRFNASVALERTNQYKRAIAVLVGVKGPLAKDAKTRIRSLRRKLAKARRR